MTGGCSTSWAYGAYVYAQSFPSGHSTASAALWLSLAMIAASFEPTRRRKATWFAFAGLIILGVGASRVYLGVHWPTDVIAGWMLGACWALTGWLAWRWLARRGPQSLDQRCFFGSVQGHRRAHQGLERRLIQRRALGQIDGAAGVPIEAGVEQARRVLQRGALGEGQLHDGLVGLARAEDASVRPHRNPRATSTSSDHLGGGP